MEDGSQRLTMEIGRGVLSHTQTPRDGMGRTSSSSGFLPYTSCHGGKVRRCCKGWWLLYDYNDLVAKDQELWAMAEREDSWVAEHGGKCPWSQYLRD